MKKLLILIILGIVIPNSSSSQTIGFSPEEKKTILQASDKQFASLQEKVLKDWYKNGVEEESKYSNRVTLFQNWSDKINAEQNMLIIYKQDIFGFGHSSLANKLEFLTGCRYLIDVTTKLQRVQVIQKCLTSFSDKTVDENWQPIMADSLEKYALEDEANKNNAKLDMEPVFDEVCMREWKELRNNEKANQGRVITWQIKVLYEWGNWVEATAPGVDLKRILISQGPLTENIHDSDFIIIHGKFLGLSQDGKVILKPLQIKNLGVQ